MARMQRSGPGWKLRQSALAACALLARCCNAVTICQELRIPPASISHKLLHIEALADPPEQARAMAKEWGFPQHKIPYVLRQIEEAKHDMMRHDASEALVNVTVNYTLDYVITVSNTVEEMLTLVPEHPLRETVIDFCQRFGVKTQCDQLYTSVEKLVLRDWGCRSYEEPEISTNEEPLIRLELSAHGNASSAAEPSISFIVNGSAIVYTVREDQDLELQGAQLCWQWRVALDDCALLMDRLLVVTRDRPSSSTHIISNHTEPQLRITSLKHGTLHPKPLRLYYEGFWVSNDSHMDLTQRNVCMFANYARQPVFCGLFPQLDLMFTRPETLTPGYHVFFFTANTTALSIDTIEIPFIAARHLWVVEPSIKAITTKVQASDAGAFISTRVETTAFNYLDPSHRLCMQLNGAFDCFIPSKLHVESDGGVNGDRKTVFRVPVIIPGPGPLDLTLFLMDTYSRVFAVSESLAMNVSLNAAVRLLPRDDSQFHTPFVSPSHIQRPAHCPEAVRASTRAWICDLWRNEWGVFSQNGEDGVLESIFYHIGTTNKFYVEFGTEDGQECNTRWLRSLRKWTGLLMDGKHENPTINLHREWVSPENINALLAKHAVPQQFDLLSIDVDFNDYWILDAIDRTRFAPRVLVIEVNSHAPPTEARTVVYNGPLQRWDGRTDYFGTSVAAVHKWGQRHGYSLVYCESHGVNCFLIRDDVLSTGVGHERTARLSEMLTPEDLHTPPNFFGRGARYPANSEGQWVWV